MTKKRLEMTKEIQSQIRRGVDHAEFDTSQLVVFEAKMLSTEAITKPGFWNKARVTASTLNQMVSLVNSQGGAIPLHIMHDSTVLPVGKVFAASSYTLENGETAINGMFYLTADRENFINDIENAVIDEVSVGLKTKHGFCSECGFDYFSADASILNFFSLTCDEGHVIGENGVHVRLSEVDHFHELSLVGRGAAHKAKILPKEKHSQGSNLGTLAANGAPLEAFILRASYQMEATGQPSTNHKGDLEMDVKEMLAKLEASASTLGETKLQLTQANDKIEGLKAEIVKVTAELTASKTELDSVKAASTDAVKLKADSEETKKLLADATSKLLPHVEAALVATGMSKDSLKDLTLTFTQMVELVEEKGLKLHQAVSASASSSGEVTDVKKDSVNSTDYRKSFKVQ